MLSLALEWLQEYATSESLMGVAKKQFQTGGKERF